MYARSVDEAAARLCELRQEECGDLALAAVSLGLAFAATQIRPAFAMPFLLGGVVVGVRGTIALCRRWDLVEHLAGEQEAHVIPEVLACAAREATVERRHMYAARIRTALTETELPYRERVMVAAEELEALAAELEDDELTLGPCLGRDVQAIADRPRREPTLQPGAAAGGASVAPTSDSSRLRRQPGRRLTAEPQVVPAISCRAPAGSLRAESAAVVPQHDR